MALLGSPQEWKRQQEGDVGLTRVRGWLGGYESRAYAAQVARLEVDADGVMFPHWVTPQGRNRSQLLVPVDGGHQKTNKLNCR